MKEQDFKIGDDVHLKNGVKATIHDFETRDGVLYASCYGHLKPVKDIIKQLERVIRNGEIIFGEEEKIVETYSEKNVLMDAIRSIEEYVELYGRKERNWIPPSREEWILGEDSYKKAINVLKDYTKEKNNERI